MTTRRDLFRIGGAVAVAAAAPFDAPAADATSSAILYHPPDGSPPVAGIAGDTINLYVEGMHVRTMHCDGRRWVRGPIARNRV